jgi:hypothetical protein
MKRFVFTLQMALLVLVSASPLRAWENEAAATLDAVQVELIDAGATPRRELRLTPQKGDKETALMIMKMNLKTSVEGQETPAVPIPAQKFTIDVTVEDISAEGDITYSFVYSKAEVENDPASPAAVIQAMNEQLERMAGMSGTAVVSNVGITKSMKLNLPEDIGAAVKATLDSMKDSMNQLSSPIPVEPVGIGGKWKVTQPVKSNGLLIMQTSIHELTSVNGDGFVMDVSIAQTAEPQDVAAPNLPAGVTLKLNSLDTTGGGSSTVDFHAVFPSKSEVKVESKAKMHVEALGLKQQVDTLTTVEMTIQRPQAE